MVSLSQKQTHKDVFFLMCFVCVWELQMQLNVEVLCDVLVVSLWTGEHSFTGPELEDNFFIH